jgi:hypothetical protein
MSRFTGFAGTRGGIGNTQGGGNPAYQPAYADWRVGSAGMPGSSGASPPGAVPPLRALFGMIYENWLPFTAFIASRFLGPRAPTTDWDSPFDVSRGESAQRFGDNPSAGRAFPYPWMTGTVSGFMPMLDQYSAQWAWGKTPSGPGVLTPVPVPWDAQYPQLPKVSG